MTDFDPRPHWARIASRDAARISREVSEELQGHIDMRADQLERAGTPPREARAQAMREFGDLDDAMRYCAGVDRSTERRHRARTWLGELRRDAEHALRLLRRSPAFACATVLTLALALGASTAVYGVLHVYLVRPLPFPEADRLVSIVRAPTLDRFPNMPRLDAVEWSHIDSLFDATANWDLDGFTIPGERFAETVTGAWVTPGYFRALDVRPTIGRGFVADEYRDPAPVAIISHDLWLRRFGADSGVIGTTVAMHSVDRPNSDPLATIVGVLPPEFWPIQWRESHVLRPMPPENAMPALARLAPGASLLETQRRLDAVVRAQIGGEIDPAWHMSLFPALDRHSARVRPMLAAVFGAALFMLLAACGSITGALVSRMASRESELAIRVALGGSRGRIVRQLLTESAVLATIAGAIGLAIAYALLQVSAPLVERQIGATIPGGAAALSPTFGVMVLAAIASTLTGVALGAIPALTFLKFHRTAASAVIGVGRSDSARRSGALVRRFLIAAQVCVATVLLFGAGLMLRTLERMNTTDVGFRTEGVVKGTVTLPQASYPDSASRRRLVDRVIASLAETEGVRSAAAVYPHPFYGSAWQMPVFTEGGGTDEESAPRTMVYTVSGAYFETMGLRLRTGRAFRETDDHAAPLIVVVSEGLARRLAPQGDVIGRKIRVRVPFLASFNDTGEDPWRTVVGVVGDTKKAFESRATPDVYVPYAQNPRSLLSIVAHTDRPESSMLEPVRAAVATVDPALALSGVESMNDLIASHGEQRRGLTVLLGAFALFALCLSAWALYASLSYTVVQRRAELAVRMAIGASARSILRLVVGEGLAMAMLGVIGGVAASLALGRVLSSQVYGVETSDPATLVAISIVLAVAAVAACALPALRAVRTDPGLALRT